jgi:hypothetical protein
MASTTAASAADPPPLGNGGYRSVGPTRVLDTRTPDGGGCLSGPGAKVIDLDAKVPAVAGAGAVALNVTAIGGDQAGWITVWPGGTRPTTSSLNFDPHAAVPNMVVTAMGDGGTISVGGSKGCAHVVIDLIGSYSSANPNPDITGFKGITPSRIVDTRATQNPLDPSQPNLHVQCVENQGYVGEIIPLGKAGLPPDPGMVTARDPSAVMPWALVMNVTVVNPSGNGWVIASDATRSPLGDAAMSSFDFTAGQTHAGLVMARGMRRNDAKPGVNDQWTLSFWFHGACPEVVVDVVGWVRASQDPESQPILRSVGGTMLQAKRRIMDTRTGGTFPQANCVIGTTHVGGLEGSMPEGTSEVILMIAAVNSHGSGWVTAWNFDEPEPATSSLNYGSGPAVSNIVIVPVDHVGSVALATHGGCPHLIVDLVGWISPDRYPLT